MKNFLKKNWFKAGILFVAIVIGFSVFYYVVVFIPQKEEKTAIQNEQASRDREIEKTKEAQDQIVATYRKKCTEYEAINQKGIDDALNSILNYCNRQSDPVSCYTSGSKNTMNSLGQGVGEDYIRECTKNMIEKYGTSSPQI